MYFYIMKKILIALIAVFTFSACEVNTSSNIDFNGTDIKYVKDSRTNLCYAVIASRKSFSTDATGMGFTLVPCKDVQHLIK